MMWVAVFPQFPCTLRTLCHTLILKVCGLRSLERRAFAGVLSHCHTCFQNKYAGVCVRACEGWSHMTTYLKNKCDSVTEHSFDPSVSRLQGPHTFCHTSSHSEMKCDGALGECDTPITEEVR